MGAEQEDDILRSWEYNRAKSEFGCSHSQELCPPEQIPTRTKASSISTAQWRRNKVSEQNIDLFDSIDLCIHVRMPYASSPIGRLRGTMEGRTRSSTKNIEQ